MKCIAVHAHICLHVCPKGFFSPRNDGSRVPNLVHMFVSIKHTYMCIYMYYTGKFTFIGFLDNNNECMRVHQSLSLSDSLSLTLASSQVPWQRSCLPYRGQRSPVAMPSWLPGNHSEKRGVWQCDGTVSESLHWEWGRERKRREGAFRWHERRCLTLFVNIHM